MEFLDGLLGAGKLQDSSSSSGNRSPGASDALTLACLAISLLAPEPEPLVIQAWRGTPAQGFISTRTLDT